MRVRNGFTALVALGTAVAALAGCAAVEVPPPTPEIRAQLGGIEVEVLAIEAQDEMTTPAKGQGQGAASGAGQGALGSLAGGASICQAGEPFACLFGLALGIAVAPVAAVIGAGVGASKAHSEGEVLLAETNLRAALDELSLDRDLEAAVSTRIRAHPDYELAEAPGPGPDTRLEVRGAFSVQSSGKIDPDLTLVLGARARLVRADDGIELYARSWGYQSPTRGYFEFAADGAELFRTEVQDGIEKLADKMVADLLVSTESETYRPGSVTAGTVWAVDARVADLPRDAVPAPADGTAAVAGSPVCAASRDPARPWIGDWSARSGRSTLSLRVDENGVKGELKTPRRGFAVSGGVSDQGFIDATVNGARVYETADIRGTFPEVRVTTQMANSPSFAAVQDRAFRLCP